MNSEFSFKQPKLDSRYVMIEWDNTMSLNPKMVKPLFTMLKQIGFSPKIFVSRNKTDDNSDLLKWVEESDVLYSNGEQKKDAVHSNGLKHKNISYWIDNDFLNVVDKEDLDVLSNYVNSPEDLDNKKVFDNKDKYVFLDWDDTMSLRPDFAIRFLELFRSFGFKSKIFTARKESSDNSDIFLWVEESDVFFSNRKSKKESLSDYNLSLDNVAFWLDDLPHTVISKDDFFTKLSYYNN